MREHLRVHPRDVVGLWLAERRDRRHGELAELAAAAGIEVHRAAAEALRDLCGEALHQGAVALLREFAYASLDELVAPRPDVLFAADGVEDPRNLGALIRAVAASGAGGLIIPQDRASPVTPTVEKSSAGVTAHFPICRVVNVPRTLAALKQEHGFWVIGLTQEAPESIFEARAPLPAVVVVGGETGLRPLAARSCDLLLRIPMAAGVESLNVAVAAAVAGFELRRRQVDSSGGRW